ncbi:class I SAM-dependent methyltransferase [Luteococcus sp.]|uniref:class I SAM-dependent methyltransferase n=1 Tax=Luteococcus sp. TaxID=1969402 RepID=UPI0037358F3F
MDNDIDVAWEDAREANRLNWDDRASLHEQSYGIEAYISDPTRVSEQVRADAGALAPFLPHHSVEGLRLAHLQCHIGTDTISWARLGAQVTGLDFSEASLGVARRLAAHHDEVDFVQSDVLAAREALTGSFDVVYTSIGAICWIDDLGRWARQIAALLRPGGLFHIQDGHPMLYALGEDDGPDPRMRYRYFPTGRAQTWDDPGTYLGDGTVQHSRTYEWPHSLAEIMQSLLAAGLVIEHFDEGQTLPWRFSPAMVETGQGWAWPTPDRIPCTFTIIARRPKQS